MEQEVDYLEELLQLLLLLLLLLLQWQFLLDLCLEEKLNSAKIDSLHLVELNSQMLDIQINFKWKMMKIKMIFFFVIFIE